MKTHLPGITEKSKVLSGSEVSSLVGVEHAFLLFPCAFSGVLPVVILDVLVPGLTARGPRGREAEAAPDLALRLDWAENLEVSRLEGSTRGLTD